MKDFSRRATLLVSFGYDGAPFFGLQPQPGHPTAGGALKERLVAGAGQPPRGLAFAARTDRGVHAERSVATCWYPIAGLDLAAAAAAIAAPRPDHLVVHGVYLVDGHVHARNVAVGKHYRYVVIDGADDDEAAVEHERAWKVAPRLDVGAMREAAAHLVGTHDFTSLRGGGCSAATPVKTITRLDIQRAEGPAAGVVIDVEGDAFLRHMVRNLAGLLVEVGSGWRAASSMSAVLAAAQRQAAGLQAPAGGLCLVEVKLREPFAGLRLA